MIMRLLNTSTLKLHEFYEAEIPHYAILSHTWTKQEVSLQMLEDPKSKTLAGYTKIKRCCELAFSEGWKYAWIDTCCIDKTSSADLSEAINAMYGWYEKAQVCYVYLEDVSTDAYDERSQRFQRSRWFFRGWTLQELLAPKTLVFYDKNWEELGTKWSLGGEISLATGITDDQMMNHKRASVATKMSWAAQRETSRIEDTAYSLLGLFDINMPLLYGEGSKAFMRLQYEILQTQEDDSIFAWTDDKVQYCGLFARSPAAFARSGNIVPLKETSFQVKPRSVTRRLLMDGSDSFFHHNEKRFPCIILNCVKQGAGTDKIGIELTREDKEYYPLTYSGKKALRSSSLLDYYVRSSGEKLILNKTFSSSVKRHHDDLSHTPKQISLDNILASLSQ